MCVCVFVCLWAIPVLIFHFLKPPGNRFSGMFVQQSAASRFPVKPREKMIFKASRRSVRLGTVLHGSRGRGVKSTLLFLCIVHGFTNRCQGKCKVFSPFMWYGVLAPVGRGIPITIGIPKQAQAAHLPSMACAAFARPAGWCIVSPCRARYFAPAKYPNRPRALP